MYKILPGLVLAFALAACSTPPSDSKPAATPAPAAPVVAPAPPKPAETAAVAAELPEGACGDQSAVPKEQRLANTPRWTTASEVDNFGYEVFRGELEEGPFVKLGAEPMLGAGTTDETKKYEFRDDTIDPCKSYWYYVESISTAGVREKFTPVFQAKAKRRPAATAAAPAPQAQ